MSVVLFILICSMWGTSFLLMKWALASFGFVDVALVRVIFGAIALWVFWHFRKQPWPLRRKHIPALCVIAPFGFVVPYLIQPYVIGKVEAAAGHGSAFGGMMVSFVPLSTIIWSVPLLGVWPTKRQLFGVLGGLGFMWMLFAEELSQGVPLGYVLLGAVTPLCYGMSNTLVKKSFSDVSPVVLSMTAMAIAAVLVLPATLTVRTVEINEQFGWSLAALLVLGVFCTGIAMALFYTLVRHHGPLWAGMVTYVIPCVAILVAFLAGESLTWRQLAAMAGIFMMVALVQFGSPDGRRPLQDSFEPS